MRTHGGVKRDPREWTEAWQFTEAWPPLGEAIQHAAGSDVQDDVPLLWALVCEVEPKRMVELGTRQGTSTRTLRLAAELVGAEFLTIDPDPGCLAFIKPILHQRYCRFLQMTGQQAFPGPEPDFLFIDTDPHTYEQTVEWLDTYVQVALTPGGVAVFHDTVPARPEIQVGQAVRDWVAKHEGYIWREIPTTYGLGVLWKP